MFFTLEMLRAKKGDSMILHYGDGDEPQLMVIDGGPSNVYQPQLRKRLQALREARGLSESKSLPIEVLMVSHVDDDHIKGILELTAELRQSKDAKEPLPFKVKDLWHNSFDKLLKTTPEQLKGTAAFGVAALSGELELDEDVDEDLAMVLANVAQGAKLRDDAHFLGWSINKAFGEELVLATDEPHVVKLGKLALTTVGPLRNEVQRLQEEHDKWLRSKKSAAAGLAAFTDDSIPNLSSLVFLAELGKKRILFTGDARGDKVLDGLELAGLVEDGGTLEVDIFKAPHHGSSRNVEPEVFERIVAEHYVFSGNGEHGNPERETLQMLLDARGEESFDLYFTYDPEEIDVEREKDWNKNRERAKKKGKTVPAWSDKKHGLKSLLEKANIPNRKQKLHIVEDGEGLPIDLLDPIEQ